MTSTTAIPRLDSLVDVSVVFYGFLVSVIISILICFVIITITLITPNLQSTTNLLICNTCFATLVYLIVSIVNTTFFFVGFVLSDWSCRIQGYLGYVSLIMVAYSYVIQAISRLFLAVFFRHRYLFTYKCHLFLIICQISIAFLFPLPSLLTSNIVFRSDKMCLIPMKYKFHVAYMLIFSYFIPLISVIIIYAIIYRHIIRSSSTVRQLLHGTRRDLDVARNILILFIIYLFAGTPSVIYTFASSRNTSVSKVLYMFIVTAPPISTTIEKIVTLVLNKKIRRALKYQWFACCPGCVPLPNRIQPLLSSINQKNKNVQSITRKIHNGHKQRFDRNGLSYLPTIT